MRSLALGLISALLLLAPPAQAAKPTGTMTRYEWTGVQAGEALSKVVKACDCSGVWFGDGWPGEGGRPHRIKLFDGPAGAHGVVYFRRWRNDTWHANLEKQWWNAGNIPIDQVNWSSPHP